jgi:NAD(P)-dependent dehydrogenase (short-subunit alcohol dehydrogenase family)
VRALLPAVVAHFGRVDAVVNSASTCSSTTAQPASALPPWKSTCAANTGAPVLLAQALQPIW